METQTRNVNSFLSFSGESSKAVSFPLPQDGNEQEGNHLVTCPALASIPFQGALVSLTEAAVTLLGAGSSGVVCWLWLGQMPAPTLQTALQQVYLH